MCHKQCRVDAVRMVKRRGELLQGLPHSAACARWTAACARSSRSISLAPQPSPLPHPASPRPPKPLWLRGVLPRRRPAAAAAVANLGRTGGDADARHCMLGPPPPRPGRCPGLGAPPGWWGAHGACRCLQRARHAWAGSQGAARMLGCWAAGQGCAPHAAAGRRRWRRWSCGGGGLAAGAREAGRLPFPPQRSASRPLMRARSGWRRTGRTRSSWWGRLAARRAALGSGTRLMGVRLVSSNHQAFMQQRACCRCSPPLHLQTSQLSEPELAQALAHESREAAAVSPQCMQGLFQVLAGQGESSRGTARVVARLQPMQHRRRAARHQHAGACRRPTPPRCRSMPRMPAMPRRCRATR